MKKKNKAKIGTWITTYNPSALDVISKCNFDWICIDMEHSSITLEQLENLLNVLDKNKSNSFVRVSDNNKTEIKKVLDLGAKGIIVPMINTALEANNAISYATHPPKGQRGFGLARAQGYGYDLKNYEKISRNIKIVIQIETIEGINNFEKILKKSIFGPFWALLPKYGVKQEFPHICAWCLVIAHHDSSKRLRQYTPYREA